MMNRKEKLFAFISDENYIPLKIDEIAVLLDVPKSDYTELAQLLDELVDEGKIFKTKKNKYIGTDNSPQLVVGTLSCNSSRGFGFVRCEKEGESDIFIPLNAMNGAFDRDKVLVHIDKSENEHSRREGHIVNVIKRGNVQIVGVVRGIKSGKYVIAPDRREFFSDVLVPVPMAMDAKKGDRVLVKIDKYSERGQAYGVVLTVLGRSDSLFSCLNGVILENNYCLDFSDEVQSELESIPDEVSEEDIKDREDLRDIITFTIDGDNSRDFDDAVSLEILDNGNMLLGVHIADVTHYVKENSALDTEALNRATSVYFPHIVIPMLPQKLSNGICSLNPDVDRLTLSVFMEYDLNANLHSQRITKSVIHSHARMTYANVNKILDGDKELINEYKDISPILYKMNELSKQLIKKRDERGAIDFDFPETKIVCDDNGNPIDVQKDVRGNSERLIESFMLSANETVAETAFWSELPFIYRVHEAPDTEKLTDFNNFIKNFGHSLKSKLDSDTIHPKALQEIAKAVKGTPEEMMISKIMLRSLMKACYRDTNDGHFGLASRYYCHFTSPIRRYPDLFIHRVLKDFISGNLDDTKRAFYEKKAIDASIISSDKEVGAENAERDAVEILKTAYMQEHLGEVFDAVVSSVTSFGIFAILENSCEGLIRYQSIQSDYFEYNDKTHTAIGKRTGKEYKIGDEVEIVVAAADILSRRIDFVLSEDATFSNIQRITQHSKPIKLRKEKHKSTYTRKKKRR
ncbi:MAG: ribonuclease R [Clostridiales bacterium]|nr:ribonuclease R [Clostridiales bacterium]